MMKIKYISLFFLAASIFVSCEDDDLDGMTALPKSQATSNVTSITLTEGETDVIPFTIDKPINKPSQFKILVKDGNISQTDIFVGDQEMDADTGVPHKGFEITVPAYSDSFDIPVEAIYDILPEGTETATLEISAAGVRTILIPGNTHEVDVTINNIATTNFTFRMEWDTTYVGIDGDEHSACDFDLDLEIYTASFGGPIATSYGDCPEEINFGAGDLADGDYWLIPSFWTVASVVAPETDFQIPASLTFAKDGVWYETVDLTDQWDTATGGAQEGNPDAYLVKYVLTVSGTTYTVTDADSGTVVGTGRMSAPSVKTPSNFVGGRQ